MFYQLNFQVFNKKAALKDQLQCVREKIEANTWCLNDLLSPLIISFADLKKYHYYYWMCFPTFKLQGKFNRRAPLKLQTHQNCQMRIDKSAVAVGLL